MARNYPSSHDAERKAWLPAVEAGGVHCRRGPDCRLAPDTLIEPGTPWDLGHPDPACQAPTAPEHQRCNRATSTHRARAGQRPAEVHPALRELGLTSP